MASEIFLQEYYQFVVLKWSFTHFEDYFICEEIWIKKYKI